MSDQPPSLTFRTNLRRHLDQLSQLTGMNVRAEDLLPLDETEAIRERVKSVAYAPSWRRTIDFSERVGERFQILVGALANLNPSPVYIWTPLSNVRGLLRPLPLVTVRWQFEFDLISDGILVLLTKDLLDKMLLDYSDGPTAGRELEVEVSGQHWGRSLY